MAGQMKHVGKLDELLADDRIVSWLRVNPGRRLTSISTATGLTPAFTEQRLRHLVDTGRLIKTLGNPVTYAAAPAETQGDTA